jgi:hypothetical protein
MATRTDIKSQQSDESKVDERPAPPDLTPYAAAKVVTAKVREKTGDKTFELAPQTMYGVADRGTIKTVEKPGTKADGKSKVFFDGADFARWLKQYLAGTGTGEGRVRQNYEQLAKAYDLDDESDNTAAAEAEDIEDEHTEAEATEAE